MTHQSNELDKLKESLAQLSELSRRKLILEQSNEFYRRQNEQMEIQNQQLKKTISGYKSKH